MEKQSDATEDNNIIGITREANLGTSRLMGMGKAEQFSLKKTKL